MAKPDTARAAHHRVEYRSAAFQLTIMPGPAPAGSVRRATSTLIGFVAPIMVHHLRKKQAPRVEGATSC